MHLADSLLRIYTAFKVHIWSIPMHLLKTGHISLLLQYHVYMLSINTCATFHSERLLAYCNQGFCWIHMHSFGSNPMILPLVLCTFIFRHFDELLMNLCELMNFHAFCGSQVQYLVSLVPCFICWATLHLHLCIYTLTKFICSVLPSRYSEPAPWF